jgi:hypothetical protein
MNKKIYLDQNEIYCGGNEWEGVHLTTMTKAMRKENEAKTSCENLVSTRDGNLDSSLAWELDHIPVEVALSKLKKSSMSLIPSTSFSNSDRRYDISMRHSFWKLSCM